MCFMRFSPALMVVSNMVISPTYAAPACDALAETFGANLGATIERKSEVLGNVFLRHPAATEFVINCGPGDKIGVTVAWDGSPTADYLRLAAVAASLMVGAHDRDIGARIASCLRAARNSKTEMSETHSDHMAIDCQSFTRDGGGNVVWLSPRE